ncbi:MAG: hypothetical protein OEL57_06710 [Trichlorobacter sp.]|uniref:hypothetical protein n=1 Tax=Trichlorobacter sp. TaxID=2911007 RepID=UPI0025697B2D|nr:hypothetical protein [Trichlorobacter sp.]MDK9717588.1 hypothetical protein [Trichlorobacter sp.]
MDSLTIRVLVATVPLTILMVFITLSETIKKQHNRHTAKRLTAGALRGLSQGPQLRG